MNSNADQQKTRLFYCYSHVDEDLRNALANHLSALKRTGVITEWHDRRITAGSEWKSRIDMSLDEADIVLLLISADFLASDYCYDVEMQRALQRHEAKEAVVIPVILRPVDWSDAPFGNLQALPKDARPVTSWADRDEAFTDVSKGIRAAILDLRSSRAGKKSRRNPSGDQDESDEEGLLDLVEQGNKEFNLLTDVTMRMAGAIAELGHKAKGTIARLQPDPEGKVDPAQAKPVVDVMALSMSDFARDLASQVEEFAGARKRGLEALRKASELAPDFGEGGVRGLQSNSEHLETFRASIPKTQEQMESFRYSVARLPRLTTRLNRAKRASVRSLDALQEQLDLAMVDTDSARRRIAEVLTSMTAEVPTQSAPVGESLKPPVPDASIIKARVASALARLNLAALPSVALVATPCSPTSIPDLFSQQGKTWAVLSDPPRLRDDGFGLYRKHKPEIFEHRLEALTPETHGAFVWPDGLVVAAMDAGPGHLCYGSGDEEG